MIRGFYSARSGLVAHQEHMSVMANNIANVNTGGFKPMRTAFTDLMYQNLNRPINENVAQTGHGVKINKNDVNMNSGSLVPSGGQFDFAIIDEGGFFSVQTPAGDVRYSRAGAFRISNDEGTCYLVDGSGNRVLTADGSEIEVTFDDASNVDFDPSEIGVFRFPNPWGLESREGTTFVQTEMSGEPEAIESPNLKQGYTEGSGVEISVEMVNVIEASKAFSFNSRMVQVADEIEQTINGLRA